jgi:hypothetical protein
LYGEDLLTFMERRPLFSLKKGAKNVTLMKVFLSRNRKNGEEN